MNVNPHYLRIGGSGLGGQYILPTTIFTSEIVGTLLSYIAALNFKDILYLCHICNMYQVEVIMSMLHVQSWTSNISKVGHPTLAK